MKELPGEKLQQTHMERNSHILRAWYPRWVSNTAENYASRIIENDFKANGDKSINGIPKHTGEPAIIVGSGPSLDKSAPFLKDWKGAIFCSASNSKVLKKHGRDPDYMCVFDANRDCFSQLDGVEWPNTTLLSHIAIAPEVYDYWKWNKYYYMMLHPGDAVSICIPKSDEIFKDWKKHDNGSYTIPGIDGNNMHVIERDDNYLLNLKFEEKWFTEIQRMLFPYVNTGILNAGCTVNNAIEIAAFLGYGPLYLVGVDFGFPNDVFRCTNYDYVDGSWVDVETPPINPMRQLHISDNGIKTFEEQIEYKNAMFAVYKIDKPQLIDCSDGIITELPKANIKEVIEKDGKGFEHLYRSNEEIITCCNSILDRRKEIINEGNVDRPSS